MTKSLEKAAHKIISIVNRDKDHIPPITTADANPFPYQIVVNPKSVAENDWRPRIGLFLGCCYKARASWTRLYIQRAPCYVIKKRIFNTPTTNRPSDSKEAEK
jgi:hypothetical protein